MFDLFSPKKPEVIHHWFTLVDNFNTSAQDFYATLEEELKKRKVPGLDVARVDFAEGGLLSQKREYLRLTRERLVFDICAAPFGTSFFFSSRFAEHPLMINPWAIVLLLISGLAVLNLFIQFLGLFQGLFLFLLLFGFSVWLLRNAVALNLKDIDSTLLKIPLMGSVYEKWLRKETYYRTDTRLMYLETVPYVVKALVEEITAAKGVKMVRQYELAPILGELYKPIGPKPMTKEPAKSVSVEI